MGAVKVHNSMGQVIQAITTIGDYENGMALLVLGSLEPRTTRDQFVGNNSLYYLALLIEC